MLPFLQHATTIPQPACHCTTYKNCCAYVSLTCVNSEVRPQVDPRIYRSCPRLDNPFLFRLPFFSPLSATSCSHFRKATNLLWSTALWSKDCSTEDRQKKKEKSPCSLRAPFCDSICTFVPVRPHALGRARETE